MEMMSAPASARAIVIAAPRLRVAPVTRAVLPVRLKSSGTDMVRECEMYALGMRCVEEGCGGLRSKDSDLRVGSLVQLCCDECCWVWLQVTALFANGECLYTCKRGGCLITNQELALIALSISHE